jgi:hypothetical protein
LSAWAGSDDWPVGRAVYVENTLVADVLDRLKDFEERMTAAPLVAVARRAVAYVKTFGKPPSNTVGDWKGLSEKTYSARVAYRAGRVFPADFIAVIDSDPIMSAWWREPKKKKTKDLGEKLEIIRRRMTALPNKPIAQAEIFEGIKIGAIVDRLRAARKAGRLSAGFIAAFDAIDTSILKLEGNVAEAMRRRVADPVWRAKVAEIQRAANRRPEVCAAKSARNKEAFRRRREYCAEVGLAKPGRYFCNMDKAGYSAWEASRYPADKD